jgi:hypothetical protein
MRDLFHLDGGEVAAHPLRADVGRTIGVPVDNHTTGEGFQLTLREPLPISAGDMKRNQLAPAALGLTAELLT